MFDSFFISPETESPKRKLVRVPEGRLGSQDIAAPEFLTDRDFGGNAGVVRKIFTFHPGRRQRLAIVSHGVFEAYVNGKKVSDEIMAPGPSYYYSRVPARSYDVTEFIKDGENEIRIILGNGWYRGSAAGGGAPMLYGIDLSVMAVLFDDEKECLITDGSWDASTNIMIRGNDIARGEICDGRLLGKEVFSRKARVLSLIKDDIFISEERPIVRDNGIPAVPEKKEPSEKDNDASKSDGTVRYYYKAALENAVTGTAGLEIKNAPEGGRVRLTLYSEPGIEKEEGLIPGLYPKEYPGNEIRYVCREGENSYIPHFTAAVFSCIEIETDFDPEEAGLSVKAYPIHKSTSQRAFFESSSKELSAVFADGIAEALGALFAGPAYRLAGLTGVIAAQAPAVLTLYDSAEIYNEWLLNCEAGQKKSGKIETACPAAFEPWGRPGKFSGSTGWGDALVSVPLLLYRMTGEIKILERFYPMMKKWVGFLLDRAQKSPRKKSPEYRRYDRKNPWRRYTIDTGRDTGELFEPGTDGGPQPDDMNGRGESATAYLSYSAHLCSEAAKLLAESRSSKDAVYKRLISEAVEFSGNSEKAKNAYRYMFIKDGKISSERMCLYIRALSFRLLEMDEREEALSELDRLIAENHYAVNTGLLSTPYVLPLLFENGYEETAYRILLNEDSRKDKNPAYLSYCDSIIRYVCGIVIDAGKITIRPVPAPLSDGKPLVERAYGRLDIKEKGTVEAGFEYKDKRLFIIGKVPEAMDGITVILPDGTEHKNTKGEFSFLC